jgi:hypothetical protein
MTTAAMPAQRQQAKRAEAEPQSDGPRDPRRRNEQGREHSSALKADDPAENQRGRGDLEGEARSGQV